MLDAFEISSKMKSENFLLYSGSFRNHWCLRHHKLELCGMKMMIMTLNTSQGLALRQLKTEGAPRELCSEDVLFVLFLMKMTQA